MDVGRQISVSWLQHSVQHPAGQKMGISPVPIVEQSAFKSLKVLSPRNTHMASGMLPERLLPYTLNRFKLNIWPVSVGTVPVSWLSATRNQSSLVSSPIRVLIVPLSCALLKSRWLRLLATPSYSSSGIVPVKEVSWRSISCSSDNEPKSEGSVPVKGFPFNERNCKFVSWPTRGEMVPESWLLLRKSHSGNACKIMRNSRKRG